jgi:chromosome segregation ATPase
LEDSETRVVELQREITLSQEKLLELGKQIEDEATRVTETEEAIRAQHNEIVEKLHSKYKADVQSLQAELAEAETAKAAAQESSLKAIEEAQQAATAKVALETAEALEKFRAEHASEVSAKAEALEKLKAEHASALEVLNAELARAKGANTSAAGVTAERESEIAALKSQIEQDNEKLEVLKAEHQSALTALKKSLAEEHESAVTALKSGHAADLAKGSTDATSAYEKQVAELTQRHEATTKELQTRIEEAVAISAALEVSHKLKLDSYQTESSAAISKLEAKIVALKAKAEADSESLAKSSKEITELKEKSESTQKQLVLAEKDLSAAAKKLEALEAQSAKDVKALATAQSELAAAKQEATSLQKIIDTFDADGKSKDELHNKVKAELAAAAKSLGDKTKEISSLQEKHRKELETISNDYEKEIEALQSNSGVKEELEALKLDYEALTKSHNDATAAHVVGLEQLKSSHSTAIAAHAKELENLKKANAAAIVALDDRETTHKKALDDLKTLHARNLDEAHDRAMTAGHAAHASELVQLQASHTDAINALKEQHEAILASALSDAEKHKVDIAKSNDSLLKVQAELNAVQQALALEKTQKASALADLDAAINKKPDTSEADGLRKELQALKDQHQATLKAAQQESAKATEEQLATKSALEKLQAEIGRQKAESSSDYRDMHGFLTQLVEEANKKAADAEARLKETEAIVKVKDAELAEAKV